jgi:hypothetical protein
MERKVTAETVMALGTFKEFNDYPERIWSLQKTDL